MSEISKQALKVDNNTSFPNNNTGYISPTILRAFNVNMIDSLVDEITFTAFSGSVTSSIQQLSAFTSSQQPSFTSLNAFTASQAIVNTNLNQFTQSANASISKLDTFSSSFNAYTASINQIRSNGVVLGNSTIFNLVGPGTFFSASLVQNIQGNIATLTFTSDNGKVNTSSFNDYTASTAASQSVFSASVATSFSSSNATFTAFSQSQNNFNLSATASLVELLNLSSSLSGGYATQGELDQSASALQANIDTKTNTSSFNAFTQSFNQYSSSQALVNGTFATTGSNTFYGQQVIENNTLWVLNNNIQLASNTQNSGAAFIGVYSSVDTTTDPSNVFSAYNITSDSGNTFGYGISSYNHTSGLPTYCFYGPGIGNNDVFGTPDNVLFQMFEGNNKLFIKRNTVLSGSLEVSSSANFASGLSVSGSTLVSGSLTITGSVYQNVSASFITLQTASIDLSKANYFTLTLSGSANINVLNPQPGITATLVINTSTNASASFSNNVKQPSGSFYAASPSGNIDIISFTAVDSTTVYAFPAQSFV